jgi:dTDP-4-dehydrorhamnose reductase
MKTILITGANGFVSWYLVRDLLKQDHKIIATSRGVSRLSFQDPRLIYETLDFTNADDVNAVFKKYKPDVVVHAGAMSKPDECEINRDAAFLTNVKGTEYLLQAAALCKSFFLFVSTDFVFEGKSLHYIERDALNPVNYYGETKKLAEEAVQNYVGKWSIVRTVLVYGKPMSGRQNILTIVAQMLESGEPYKVFNDQTRMPTYVEDLATALITILHKQATGIFHICGIDVLTPYQMACAAAEHLGYAIDQLEKVTAATFKQPAARPPVTGFDLSKAAAALGYKPTPFAEGLKKTFAI